MIPLALKLKNFKGHSVSNIDFSLLSNAIAIVGNEDNSNKKSNAVGKTTIFEAIEFVLFNSKTSRTKDGVVRKGTKKCNVIFDFKVADGSVYRIERSRTAKTNNVGLFVRNNGQWEDKTQRRNTDTDNDIQNIIGINSQTFRNSLYFKQNDLFNLASATKEKRKEIIKGMLNLTIWDRFKKIASKYKDQDETQLKIVDAKLQEYVFDNDTDPEKELTNLKISLSNTIKAKNNIEEQITIIKNDLKNKIEKLNKIKNITGNKEQIEKQYQNAMLYKDEATDNYARLIENIEETKKSITTLSEKLIIKKPMAEGVASKISKLVEMEIEQRPDFNKHEEFEKLYATYNTEIRELEALKVRLGKKLPDDSYCPSCASILDESNRAKIQSSKDVRIKSTINALEGLCEKRDNVSIDLRSLQIEINQYEENKSNIEVYASKLDFIKNEIDSIKENLGELEKRRDWLILKTEPAKTSMESSVKGYDKAKEMKVALMGQKGLDQLKKLEEDIDFISDNQYDYESNYQDIIGTEAVIREKIINKEEIIGKIKKLKAEKKSIEYRFNISSVGSFAFSSHGVPFMIISSVLDAIQTETNKVLSILRNGMQVQFVVDKDDKDTLDMRFFVESDEWGWEDLSGGQQGSVALALKFAMAVVNRKRCGADVRLLMLDEVDQPLDPESVDSFYKIIKEWSKNMVIMVITHNEQLKSKFSDCIVVKKQQGVSTASVVIS